MCEMCLASEVNIGDVPVLCQLLKRFLLATEENSITQSLIKATDVLLSNNWTENNIKHDGRRVYHTF